MTTNTQGSSRRRNLGRQALVLMLMLLTTPAIPSRVAAQSPSTLRPTVITTVLASNVTPVNSDGTFTTNGPVTLTFRTPALPDRAEVVKATLQLTASSMLTSADGSVQVYFGANKDVFGGQPFNRTTPGNDRPMQWTTTTVPDGLKRLSANQPGAPFDLHLDPNRAARQWYPINASNSSFRPRLILEYFVPDRPALIQTQGIPATQSPKSYLPNPAAAQFNSRVVSSMWSYTPVSYKGVLYLISQQNNASQLQALSALGGPPLWSVPLSTPAQHLLVSESGRIYIVGNGILVYQINAAGPPTQVKTLGNPANVAPTLAPALGADGSLFFTNDQKEIYGLNPELQELWKVTLTGTATSRVTVGPSGHYVYLTSNGEGLVAINSQTGEKATIGTSDSQAKLANTNNITFHAPVVIQHPNGTEKIYVAANSTKTGVLANFSNFKTVPKADKSATITEGWAPMTGLWSQPIADQLSAGTRDQPSTTKKIYAVQVTNSQGTVMAIDWLNGAPAKPKSQTFPVAASANLPPDILNTGRNGGNVAIGNDGTVLISTGSDVKIYAFTSGTDLASPVATSSGLTLGSRVLFGSDGTLYAIDPSGNGTLSAILPQYDKPVATMSSPTHIKVTGNVNASTRISAPGNIFLGSGLTVKQGATLSVQQPKQ